MPYRFVQFGDATYTARRLQGQLLRLRTVDGVEEGEYTKSFLLPFEPLEEVFQKLSKQDLCKNVSGRWRLTPKGFMLSNSIIVLLLEQQQKSKPLAQKK